MKQAVVEFRQFAQGPVPRRIDPFLRTRIEWKVWVGALTLVVLALLVILKFAHLERLADQVRLDLLPTVTTSGRIYQVWEIEKPDVIETDGILRGYKYVYAIDGTADNDGYCFAFSHPHAVGDSVSVSYLQSDPAISVIQGYYLSPYVLVARFQMIGAGFLLAYAAFQIFRSAKFIRFLESADTVSGVIEDVQPSGWRTWSVSTKFLHSGEEYRLKSVVKARSKAEILEIPTTFGDVIVFVRPRRKGKKSVVAEFQALSSWG